MKMNCTASSAEWLYYARFGRDGAVRRIASTAEHICAEHAWGFLDHDAYHGLILEFRHATASGFLFVSLILGKDLVNNETSDKELSLVTQPRCIHDNDLSSLEGDDHVIEGRLTGSCAKGAIMTNEVALLSDVQP